MKNIFVIILCLLGFQAFATDDAPTIIARVNKKFAVVNDYSADVYMTFNIPGVKVKNLNGKAFYKKPNKFRIRAKGIFFLPKQNMAQQMNGMLADTKSYTALLSGYEKIGVVNCAVINIIPLTTEGELIIGKFWIDPVANQVMKTQITTKNSGTIETFNTFGANAAQGLPSKIEIRVETGKFKVPKMFAADINKSSSSKSQTPAPKYGTIQLNMSNYKLNIKVEDKIFTEKDE
jgi:outer membrane lipoprotein-sorting protein